MKGIKFAIGLAFILSALSLAGNAFLFQRYTTEKTARQQLESRQAQLEDQNSFLQSEVSRMEQFKQENERFLAQIKDYTSQRDNLKKELEGTYQQVSDLKKRIQELESEKAELVQQVNFGQVTDQAMVREAAKLPVVPPTKVEEKKVPGGEAKKKDAQAEVKPENNKSSKSDKSEKKTDEKAASKEIVDPRPLQVLSVNRQFKFVVVNVGLRSHVKLGDTLRVEQNGKLIGRIQVEKLYESFSACAIVEEIQPAQIREGDLVRIA